MLGEDQPETRPAKRRRQASQKAASRPAKQRVIKRRKKVLDDLGATRPAPFFLEGQVCARRRVRFAPDEELTSVCYFYKVHTFASSLCTEGTVGHTKAIPRCKTRLKDCMT